MSLKLIRRHTVKVVGKNHLLSKCLFCDNIDVSKMSTYIQIKYKLGLQDMIVNLETKGQHEIGKSIVIGMGYRTSQLLVSLEL